MMAEYAGRRDRRDRGCPYVYNIITVICCAGAVTKLSGYQQSALKYHILSANCLGDETGILNCSYTLMPSQSMCSSSAGVICQGMINHTLHVPQALKLMTIIIF